MNQNLPHFLTSPNKETQNDMIILDTHSSANNGINHQPHHIEKSNHDSVSNNHDLVSNNHDIASNNHDSANNIHDIENSNSHMKNHRLKHHHVDSSHLNALDEIFMIDSQKIKDENDEFIDRIIQNNGNNLMSSINDSHLNEEDDDFDSNYYQDNRDVHQVNHRDDHQGNHQHLDRDNHQDVHQGNHQHLDQDNHHQSNYQPTPLLQPFNSPPQPTPLLPPFQLNTEIPDITPDNIIQYYFLFIQTYHTYSNQNLKCKEKEHLLKYNQPPKYQKKSFTLHHLYQVAKRTRGIKWAQSWCEIARHLGFDTRGTNIAARIKDWVVYHHVSAFCDYLLGQRNTFYMTDSSLVHHSFDPIPIRKRGRPKKEGHHQVVRWNNQDGEEGEEVDQVEEGAGAGQAETEAEAEEEEAIAGQERRIVIDFTSDDMLLTTKTPNQVILEIDRVCADAIDELKPTLYEAKDTIINQQRQLERVKRQNSELQRTIDAVFRLVKSSIRR